RLPADTWERPFRSQGLRKSSSRCERRYEPRSRPALESLSSGRIRGIAENSIAGLLGNRLQIGRKANRAPITRKRHDQRVSVTWDASRPCPFKTFREPGCDSSIRLNTEYIPRSPVNKGLPRRNDRNVLPRSI